MTEIGTMAGDRRAGIGTGRFIAVVGPSGAGKDTLIALARAACADDAGIVFPRRVVTRDASRFEDNEPVSIEGFQQALERGDFAMHWQAHGHRYALPRAVEEELRAGRTVVANISRTVVDATRRAYDDVVVVLVTAPPDILAERLAARDRGSDGRIANRLGRAVDEGAFTPDVTIINVGNAEDHARALLRVIRRN